MGMNRIWSAEFGPYRRSFHLGARAGARGRGPRRHWPESARWPAHVNGRGDNEDNEEPRPASGAEGPPSEWMKCQLFLPASQLEWRVARGPLPPVGASGSVGGETSAPVAVEPAPGGQIWGPDLLAPKVGPARGLFEASECSRRPHRGSRLRAPAGRAGSRSGQTPCGFTTSTCARV